MSVLRIYWQAAWPDVFEALDWALLDKQGSLLAQGHDAVAAWPEASRLELVLPAGHTLFVAASLPPGRQLQGEALGFALEEQLANDPAANLYQIGALLADGRRQIAVVELASLRHALARLQQYGREVALIVPEECLLPQLATGLSLAQLGSGWLWRGAQGECGFVPQAMAGVLLPRLLADGGQLRLSGERPQDVVLPDDIEVAEAFDWRKARSSGVINFAQGALAPRRGKGGGWLPLLGWSLAGLLLLQTVLMGGFSGWLAWQKQQLQQQTRSELQSWAPQALPGNAVQPLRQVVDGLKLASGQTPDSDVLLMAAELAALPGASALRLDSLDYADGVLRFRSAALSETQLKEWQPMLASRGLKINAGSSEQGEREWRLLRGK